jgi:hypothetical protein
MYLEDEMPGKGDTGKGDTKSDGIIEAPRRKSEALEAQTEVIETEPLDPIDEAAEKKKLRKLIKEMFPEEQIEKQTGGRDINALALDELVQLKEELMAHKG